MKKSTSGKVGKVVKIDEGRIRDHPGEMVRGTVEETLKTGISAGESRGSHR